MSNLVSIALAGVAGVLLRYFLSTSIDQKFNGTFPWGTVSVNLLGCFVAGFLLHLLYGRIDPSSPLSDPRLRNALMVGFLGGFTTYSAYSLQLLTLYQSGHWQLAAANLVVSNAGGVALAWAGYLLARSLIQL